MVSGINLLGVAFADCWIAITLGFGAVYGAGIGAYSGGFLGQRGNGFMVIWAATGGAPVLVCCLFQPWRMGARLCGNRISVESDRQLVCC